MREHSWRSDRRKTAERLRHFAFVLNQAASALRSVLLIVSVMTALTTIAGKRDLAGFIVYVHRAGFFRSCRSSSASLRSCGDSGRSGIAPNSARRSLRILAHQKPSQR